MKMRRWFHAMIGLLGSAAFFIGSILFLPRFVEYKTVGVWLFIFGSFFMLLGAIGRIVTSGPLASPNRPPELRDPLVKDRATLDSPES